MCSDVEFKRASRTSRWVNKQRLKRVKILRVILYYKTDENATQHIRM